MWEAIITAVLSVLFGSGIALVSAHILWRRAYPEKPRRRFLIWAFICFGIAIIGTGVIWLVFHG